MNLDTVKGNWNQLKGEIKSRWAGLTDDDLLEIEGMRDKFIGKLQTKYGYAKERAEQEIDEWNQKHNLW